MLGSCRVIDFKSKYFEFPKAKASTSSAAANFFETAKKLEKCYRCLGLQSSCGKETLKSRYLELVKRYHPDSNTADASSEKFNEVRQAYRYIVNNDFSTNDQEELSEVATQFDIRHTAPQHRQYLEHEVLLSILFFVYVTVLGHW